jgi:hypothetical protein
MLIVNPQFILKYLISAYRVMLEPISHCPL